MKYQTNDEPQEKLSGQQIFQRWGREGQQWGARNCSDIGVLGAPCMLAST